MQRKQAVQTFEVGSIFFCNGDTHEHLGTQFERFIYIFLPQHLVTTSSIMPLPIFQTCGQTVTYCSLVYTNLYLMPSFFPGKVEYCDTGGMQNNCACQAGYFWEKRAVAQPQEWSSCARHFAERFFFQYPNPLSNITQKNLFEKPFPIELF